MLVKLFVTFAALLINLAETVWNISFSRLVGLERHRSCDLVVPIFCPDPIAVAQTGRPGQHRHVERNADRVTKSSQYSLRIFQNIPRVHNWNCFASSFANEIENFALLNEAEIFQYRLRILFDIGENYFAGVADEKAIRKIDSPFPIDFRQQVVGHLFLEENTFAGGDGPCSQIGGNFLPTGLASSNDFGGAGMLLAGRL